MYLCKDYIFFRYKFEYIKVSIYLHSDTNGQFNFFEITRMGVYVSVTLS